MVADCTLSILVPTYRRADLLKVCLQSIVDAGIKMIEVVIGDDGGDSDTIKVCSEFALQLPIKYLAPKPYPLKGSLSSNLTRLVNTASGDWILLLHDDDFLVGDHSLFPNKFADKYDFYFTDHFNANENGELNNEKTLFASKKYGREFLQEGLQKDVFDLAINERVCLDGFYMKTNFAKKVTPNESLGPVADFFWMFYLLNSGVRVGYSNEKTFAYRTTEAGLTASGIDFDSLIKGYKLLKSDFTIYNSAINKKISYYSWYAVNKSLREGERKKAWQYLQGINFHYSHSFKSQILMLVQLMLMVLPTGIAKKLHNKL